MITLNQFINSINNNQVVFTNGVIWFRYMVRYNESECDLEYVLESSKTPKFETIIDDMTWDMDTDLKVLYGAYMELLSGYNSHYNPDSGLQDGIDLVTELMAA